MDELLKESSEEGKRIRRSMENCGDNHLALQGKKSGRKEGYTIFLSGHI
jgi:hypothetical protein